EKYQNLVVKIVRLGRCKVKLNSKIQLTIQKLCILRVEQIKVYCIEILSSLNPTALYFQSSKKVKRF
ncbi:hypothetical protein, partial [Campylobacter pinnipediorum]|uniref:hypothetical protein n=1 Tax=Campylobacter pinnipediorum TaxID=1965231 RepID=UPI0013015472